MRFSVWTFLFIGFFILNTASHAAALAIADVSWTASGTSSVSGYRIYYGTASRQYSSVVDVGKTTSTVLSNLQYSTAYYFAVSAYQSDGTESALSTELRVISTTAPTNDTDRDGLTDAFEAQIGTNPLIADTDGDGVSDSAEYSAGTNPRDRGSVALNLSLTACSSWNSYLGMFNVLEHVNLSSHSLNVTSTLYDSTGTARDGANFSIPSGAQFDLLVHDMRGRNPNSYGIICSDHDGRASDLDGRMVNYRPSIGDNGRFETFDFALALPLSSGTRGEQFVFYNTFQPSLDSSESENLVANWLQLTNIGTNQVNGTLELYDMSGRLISSSAISLLPFARQDIAAHTVGRNRVGIAAWRPSNPNTAIEFRNSRYLYDNVGNRDSFAGAFQLEGAAGSGQLLVAPLDTTNGSAVVELANVNKAAPLTVAVAIFNDAGELLRAGTYALAPMASFHLIADDILLHRRGTVRLQANLPESLAATVMEYVRNSHSGISYLYGLPAKEANGQVLHGSYNTFLGQKSQLWLSNATATAKNITLRLTRSDGNIILNDQTVPLPANGLKVITVNDIEQPNFYGAVTVGGSGGQVNAWEIRTKTNQYAICAPIR